MATTFTATDGTTTWTFARLSTSLGRKALFFSPRAPTIDRREYHVPGVDGVYITRMGRNGHMIQLGFRYVGPNDASENDPFVMEGADQTAWYNTALSLTHSGITYARCELMSFQRMTYPKPTGRNETPNPYLWFDVQCDFKRMA